MDQRIGKMKTQTLSAVCFRTISFDLNMKAAIQMVTQNRAYIKDQIPILDINK